MQPAKKGTEIIAIDLLRACAALGVFFYHSQVGSIAARYSGLSFFKRIDAFGAMYAVPLFFLLSGYCIHASNIKYLAKNSRLPVGEYFRRRFLRIYPPYLVALLVALGVNLLTRYQQVPSISDVVIHVFSVQGFTTTYFNSINLVLWTISVELAFYAIYPLFYYARYKFGLNQAMMLTLLVSCISIVFFETRAVISLPERFCVFNMWFAWCCGAFLADKKMLAENDLKKNIYLLAYAALLVAFTWFKFFTGRLVLVSDQLAILVWTGPLMFLIAKEKWLKEKRNVWVIRVMASIGLSSYSLYLLHEPVLALKNFIFHKYLPVGIQFAAVIAGFFLVPLVAWYSYYYVERPFMKKKRSIVKMQGDDNIG